MTDNEKAQIRFNLAIQFSRDKSLVELQEIYDWVTGKQGSILPVSEFKIVKQ